MPDGESALKIRDSELSPPLGSPTTISGTVDDETGIISGVTLSTPPLEFDTVALGQDVHVKATFIQQGTGSGLVVATPPAAPDGEAQKGQVILRASVIVDLELVVGDPAKPILEPHCVTPPVSLELISEGPYTESEGGLIVDPNFTVPDVSVNNAESCIEVVVNGVNSLLGGSGHSLSMFIEGDLPVPELKAETETALSVDPSGGSTRGDPVTLTASVEPDEPNDADPTGSVVFKEGTKVLGSGDLAPDGTASLTTTELRAGTRSLTATYQGDADFAPSQSAALSYTVAPAPIITGTFPEYISKGAPPIEFDVTIDNSGSTRPVANGRVDILIPTLNPGHLVLERQLPDDTWVTLPMMYSGALGGVADTLGPEDGVRVPAGAAQTYRMRVSATSTAQVRSPAIEFRLVTVDPDSGDDGPTVATARIPFNIVNAARTPTSTDFFLFDGTMRPGQTLYIEAYVTTDTGPAQIGEVEFLLDGKVMPARIDPPTIGPLAEPRDRQPVAESGQALGKVTLPSDLAAGPHVVTVRYVGTSSYLPSTSVQKPLQVIDPLGPLYACDMVSIYSDRYGAYVEAYVRLPAYAEDGEELDLEDLEVTLIPGGVITTTILSELSTGSSGTESIEIDLGEAGSIEGTSVSYTPNFDPTIDPTIPSDQILSLQDLEGTIVVDGEPGEVMPLPIESIVLSGTESFVGAGFTFTCVPQDEPVLLEEVGVSGVSLDAETATGPVRAGDPVVLTAAAAPAGPFGLVEFFTGSQSLGTASGVNGSATITVDDLPVGTNVLTARYYGVQGSPYSSEAIDLVVRPAVECPEFAEPGTGATVRLVYLELLGRCPDQAGFDYWKGRLDGGTSAAVFARTISSTPEAVGMVVEDAYQTMLGREADAVGKAFWVDRMIDRVGRYDQLLAELGSSAEFWSKAGSSNTGFVGRVYEQLLDRPADQAGQDFWVGRLNGGTPRSVLILQLANLDEPLGVLVTDSYQEILGRDPSDSERSAGITYLRSTGNRSGLYAQLIGNPEFAVRADTLPNPED